MRPVFLIALREYKQYVLSRGFILFMVMFPLVVLLGGAAIGFLESAKPVRSFVVYDHAGGYVEAIDREIAERQQRSTLAAWDVYLQIAIDPAAYDIDETPAPFAPTTITHERLKAFAEAGGVERGQEIIAPYLRKGAPVFAAPRSQFVRLPLIDAVTARTIEDAADKVRPYLMGEAQYPGAGDELFAAILIPQDFSLDEDSPPVAFWSKNLTDPALEIVIQRALASSLRRDMAENFGLDAAALEALSDVDAPFEIYRPDKVEGGAVLDNEDRIRTAVLPAAMTYLLLVVVFGVGNLLLTNTIEERSSKVVEILLSSVSADQLMLGKLVGVAAVGLTMPTVFALGGGLLTLVGLGEGGMNDVMAALFSSNLLFIYLFYFFCAYSIFAMIFLAIGAISNSLQDAQSYLGPVMLLVFAPTPFMVMVFQNPNGLIASVLTWIPIYTPYAVMMRAAADPPMWEIVGATVLMLACAFLMARVMGRIFRQGILQASPVKARDLWRLAQSERR